MSEEVDSSGLDDIVQQSMCSTTNSSHNSDDSCVDIADNRGNNFNGSDSGNYTVPEFELNRTKVAVLSIIIILTVLGNICVILVSKKAPYNFRGRQLTFVSFFPRPYSSAR